MEMKTHSGNIPLLPEYPRNRQDLPLLPFSSSPPPESCGSTTGIFHTPPSNSPRRTRYLSCSKNRSALQTPFLLQPIIITLIVFGFNKLTIFFSLSLADASQATHATLKQIPTPFFHFECKMRSLYFRPSFLQILDLFGVKRNFEFSVSVSPSELSPFNLGSMLYMFQSSSRSLFFYAQKLYCKIWTEKFESKNLQNILKQSQERNNEQPRSFNGEDIGLQIRESGFDSLSGCFLHTQPQLNIMNRTKVIGLAIAAAFFLPGSFLTAPRKEGQAWAWGFGRNGELGIGSETNTSLPHLIKNINFVEIDSKKSLSAGITNEGKLFTWGKNRNGVLGHLPGNLNVLIPRVVELNEKISQVSCGYQTMCAVTEKGEAFLWGLQQPKSRFRTIGTTQSQKSENTNAPIKVNLSNILMASCAGEYISFVNKQGKVFVMGDTNLVGINNTKAKTKTDIVELPLSHIVKISSGINFSMALDDEGKVYVWGNNGNGQLGDGGLRNTNEPILVESLQYQKVVDISAGDNYSGVVTAKGEVYTWGFGNEGQLGHGDKSDQFLPRKVTNLGQKVKNIVCGGAHTALLTQEGKLLMVGRGREGQLGREQKDESNTKHTLVPKQVQQLPSNHILKVACGSNHTLVLLQNLI